MGNAISKCGHWLVFRDYYTINEQYLINADFCKKHLLCPLCAIRRGAKYLANYLAKYQQCLKDNENLHAYMVTFTIKNGEDLNERVNFLLSHYRNMMKASRNFNDGKKGYKYYEACKALGGVYSVEVKRGKNSGLWHPHLHAVWLCEEEPNIENLKREWKEITKDSHVVDVTKFYGNVIKSFSEVFKYALKFSDMTLDDTWNAFNTLKGKRLIGNFGVLRGVVVDDEFLDSSFEEDLPFIDLFYQYATGGYDLMKKVKSDH